MAIGPSIPFNRSAPYVRSALERAARERRKLRRSEAASALYEQVPILQRALETHQRMRGAEGTGRELTESLKRYNEEATVKAMEVLYAFDRAHQKLGGD